ncbi:MAG: hypothetical protein Q7S43_01370 [bacterium]|nr:hypothetical protein [bacterium]
MEVNKEELEAIVDQRITERIQELLFPKLKIYVFPGGKKPERATDGAVGFDFFLRAVVSPFDMDPDQPVLRKTIFNFKDVPKNNPVVDGHMINYPTEKGNELAYRLDPGESILVGVGCTVEMPFPMFHWVAPRSGLASKWRITVTNAPGTVDPDYRGEAGVLLLNINSNPIPLTKDMKVAQAIFQMAIIPELVEVGSHEELTKTRRGVGGFGSTGIR